MESQMSLEKAFDLQKAEKPKTANPMHQRRQKFASAIKKQLDRLKIAPTGYLAKGRSWVWQSDAGEWFVSPRYGRRPLELAPGKHSIKVESLDAVIEALGKLKELTVDGVLDPTLEAAASEIRSSFGK